LSAGATHVLELIFLIFLQENDDTVTVERVVSVGEEDCIKTETKEDCCIQLVRTVKSEEVVSDLCWRILYAYVAYM
jgi:hypothetical protein